MRLGQRWSQGQCNIVDHRKLVLVINNDRNKQRWVLVHSPYLGAGQQQIRVGLSYRGTGLSGDLKSHKRHERSSSGSIPWDFTKEKAAIQDLCSFVSVLKCSPLIELGLHQGCDHITTPAPVIICWLIQGEDVINNMVTVLWITGYGI